MTEQQISEAKTIKKTRGGLHAIKFVRELTGLSLQDCKNLVDKLDSKATGTITWFNCKDQFPPIAHPELMGKPSDKVLVWGQNGFPLQTYYVHDAKCWFSHNNIPFEITHWAYINEPE